MYCVKGLGLDIEKVNVNGGAIALGHPLDKRDFFYIVAFGEFDLRFCYLFCAGVLHVAPDLDRLQRGYTS